MELLARNEELRELSDEKLDAPESRKAIREQAAAEKNNGRRLERLADSGAELVGQALRNPEFDAATLESLAQNVQDLKAMAETRMPGIGELLQAAAEAAKGDDPKSDPTSDPTRDPTSNAGRGSNSVGTSRANGKKNAPGNEKKEESPLPPAPKVVDSEASAYQANEQPQSPEKKDGGGGGGGRLGLPTTIVGSVPQSPKKSGDGASQQKKQSQKKLLAEAIEKQRQLLEDFAKIAQQLAEVMARLEGTTFVKRLKAASRSELKVGEGLASIVSRGFGPPAKADRSESFPRQVAAVTKGNDEVGKKLSAVMDDLDAYSARRPQQSLRTVLEEMKTLDVLGSLRQLTQDMSREAGVSIAQTEFWSDTFDRWADELVPPPCGSCNGGGTCESLPPEVVLEAMLILEAETNLREETRVAEQLRPGVEPEAFKTRAAGLASEQQGLVERVAAMVEKLIDTPDDLLRFDDEIERMKRELMPNRNRPVKFAGDIAIFKQVKAVMAEARGILAATDTGRRAIAAETEAIELLLQSRFGGGGGGGGGSSPGGGGMGGTRNAALTSLGQGINAKARHEAPEEEQSIGRSGRELPEEFRDGLDAYFNVFERSRDATGRAP